MLRQRAGFLFFGKNLFMRCWHSFSDQDKKKDMNNFWRTLIAGYAGWKWGGGCLGFVVVFIIVFYLLGYIHC
jgi:hypothetical protein